MRRQFDSGLGGLNRRPTWLSELRGFFLSCRYCWKPTKFARVPQRAFSRFYGLARAPSPITRNCTTFPRVCRELAPVVFRGCLQSAPCAAYHLDAKIRSGSVICFRSSSNAASQATVCPAACLWASIDQPLATTGRGAQRRPFICLAFQGEPGRPQVRSSMPAPPVSPVSSAGYAQAPGMPISSNLGCSIDETFSINSRSAEEPGYYRHRAHDVLQ